MYPLSLIDKLSLPLPLNLMLCLSDICVYMYVVLNSLFPRLSFFYRMPSKAKKTHLNGAWPISRIFKTVLKSFQRAQRIARWVWIHAQLYFEYIYIFFSLLFIISPYVSLCHLPLHFLLSHPLPTYIYLIIFVLASTAPTWRKDSLERGRARAAAEGE